MKKFTAKEVALGAVSLLGSLLFLFALSGTAQNFFTMIGQTFIGQGVAWYGLILPVVQFLLFIAGIALVILNVASLLFIKGKGCLAVEIATLAFAVAGLLFHNFWVFVEIIIVGVSESGDTWVWYSIFSGFGVLIEYTVSLLLVALCAAAYFVLRFRKPKKSAAEPVNAPETAETAEIGENNENNDHCEISEIADGTENGAPMSGGDE